MKQVCMMQYTLPGTLDLKFKLDGLKTQKCHPLTPHMKSNHAMLFGLAVYSY